MARSRKGKKKPSLLTRFRSAVSGRYVSRRYAKANPRTTVKERDRRRR